MSGLDFLTTFFLDGAARAIIGDTFDPGFDPDAFKPWCDVTITPLLFGADSQEIRITQQDPKLLMLMAPVAARLETGVLKLVRGPAPASEIPDAGEYEEQEESIGVPLIAETPALELPEGVHLAYHVAFGEMKINGGRFRYENFTFMAPTVETRVDIATVDRVDLPPSHGNDVVVRMIPDAVTKNEDGETVFLANGIALGEVDLGGPVQWVEVDEGPPRMWQQKRMDTGELLGEPVDYLPDVIEEVAEEIESQVPSAVNAELAGRPLPYEAVEESGLYNSIRLGPNDEFWGGDRKDGSTEIAVARIAGGKTYAADVEGFAFIPYVDANDRIGEGALDLSGQFPLVTLKAQQTRLTASLPLDIIVSAGQSNASRRAYAAITQTGVSDVFRWTGTEFVVESGTPWLGWAFAKRYAELYARPVGRRVAVVDAAAGGTGFSTNDPTWDRAKSATVNLYAQMIAKAATTLAAAPAGSRIVAFLWSQGEQDRFDMTASAYQAKLDDLITQARIDLGITDLPFILGSLTPEIINTGAHRVQGAAINAVLEDTPRRLVRTAFIDGPKNMVENADLGIHWLPQGQEARGIKMAELGYLTAQYNTLTAKALPPQNLRVSRSGDQAIIEWDHPATRVTSYTIPVSTDSGSSWSPVTLSAPTTHRHALTVPAGTPLWVRGTSTNEVETSFSTLEVHA